MVALTLAFASSAVSCSDGHDASTSAARAQAVSLHGVPVLRGATVGPGATLGPGFEIVPGSRLVGVRFPDRAAPGWRALLLVDGDPARVIGDYLQQASALGLPKTRPDCSRVRDLVPVAALLRRARSGNDNVVERWSTGRHLRRMAAVPDRVAGPATFGRAVVPV